MRQPELTGRTPRVEHAVEVVAQHAERGQELGVPGEVDLAPQPFFLAKHRNPELKAVDPM